METLMEMAALMGEPVYDEDLSDGSIWDTVVWAFRSVSREA